jgi:stage 0 sporulation protein B (sporulation initiation phosphotransferase)
MENWKAVRLLLAALAVVLLLAAVWVSGHWLAGLLLLLAAACALFWHHLSLREAVNSANRHMAQTEKHLLRLFSTCRHDWMNDLQVLHAYVKLKKYDRLLPYLTTIKGKYQQDSTLQQSGMLSLIPFFHELRAQDQLHLEVEIDANSGLSLFRDALPLELLQSIVRLFTVHTRSEGKADNRLSFHISCQDKELRIVFDYRGALETEPFRAQFQELVKKHHSGKHLHIYSEIEDDGTYIALIISLHP